MVKSSGNDKIKTLFHISLRFVLLNKVKGYIQSCSFHGKSLQQFLPAARCYVAFHIKKQRRMSKDITGTGIKLTEYSKINIFITKFQVSHQTKFIPWTYSFSLSVDRRAAISKKLTNSTVYKINFPAQQISVKLVQILSCSSSPVIS